MTPIELAGAYQPISHSGVARGPHLVTGVWNAGGRDTPISDGRNDEVLFSEATSARLMQMMIGVMRNGTGHAVHDALPEDLQPKVGGKSGTTDENRDAWFAGFTPYETIVTWVGFDDAIPMGPGCTGGKMAGPVWARTASAIWEARTPDERLASLPMPAGWTLVEREDQAVAMRTADLALPPPPMEITIVPYVPPTAASSAYDSEGAPEEVPEEEPIENFEMED
jgi:penicillin-binding protein 1A